MFLNFGLSTKHLKSIIIVPPDGVRHRHPHRALAERGPIVHEVTALLEKIAAPIGGFDRIADGVREGLLYDVVRVGGRLGGPIPEGAAKAMDRHIASLHLLQHIRHGHVAQALLAVRFASIRWE